MEGGLGIKDLVMFNHSLLAKWRWRLLRGNEGLWSRVLQGKYGAYDMAFQDGASPNGLVWWTDLWIACEGKEGWFEDYARKEVGKGDATMFWEDRWLRNGMMLKHKY